MRIPSSCTTTFQGNQAASGAAVPSQNGWRANDTESPDGSKERHITDVSIRRESWILNETYDRTDKKPDG